MNKLSTKVIGVLLLLSGSSLPGFTQNYTPENPPEPNQYFKLTVDSDPAYISYISGSGSYMEGTSVWINASANSTNYKFDHWSLNGKDYGTEQNFIYTTPAAKSSLVAHFKYVPENPAEPTLVVKKRLYLNCTPEGSCSFNRTSGEKVETDSYVWMYCYANSSYKFLGWYANGVLVSTNIDFNFQMPGSETTLTAMFKYSPSNPGEPGSAGGDIQNTALGDVNADGSINVTDAMKIINAVVSETTAQISKGVGDMNNDGIINTTDAMEIIKYSIGTK